MHHKIDIKSSIVGALLGAMAMVSIGAAMETRATAWEYKIVYANINNFTNLEKVANEGGKVGWEAVTAIDNAGGQRWMLMKRALK